MPERAINIYRESGRLTFHASGPDRDPAFMVVSEAEWRVEGDELVLSKGGREARLTALQAAVAARSGLFGLSLFYVSQGKPKAPAGPKRKGWRAPR